MLQNHKLGATVWSLPQISKLSSLFYFNFNQLRHILLIETDTQILPNELLILYEYYDKILFMLGCIIAMTDTGLNNYSSILCT